MDVLERELARLGRWRRFKLTAHGWRDWWFEDGKEYRQILVAVWTFAIGLALAHTFWMVAISWSPWSRVAVGAAGVGFILAATVFASFLIREDF